MKVVAQCTGKSFMRDLQCGEFGFQYIQRLFDIYSAVADGFENHKARKRDRDRDSGDDGDSLVWRRFKWLKLDSNTIWAEPLGTAEWTQRAYEASVKVQRFEEERRANALIDWQSGSTCYVKADINEPLLAHDNDVEEEAKASVAVKIKAKKKLKSAQMPAPQGVVVSSNLDVAPTVRLEAAADVELRLKLEKAHA